MPLEAKAALGLYAFGSYGPATGGADAAAIGADVAAPGAIVGSEPVGRTGLVAFVIALGEDVSLSANALAAFGYAAGGAPANVADEVTGIDTLAGIGGKPATAEPAAGELVAARFADDGGAAGVSPATATGFGED
jgi:hypothetical protein